MYLGQRLQIEGYFVTLRNPTSPNTCILTHMLKYGLDNEYPWSCLSLLPINETPTLTQITGDINTSIRNLTEIPHC